MSLRRLVHSTAIAAARSSSHAPWRAGHHHRVLFNSFSSATSLPANYASLPSSSRPLTVAVTGRDALRSARTLVEKHAILHSTAGAAAAGMEANATTRMTDVSRRISTPNIRGGKKTSASAPRVPGEPLASLAARRRCASSSGSGGGGGGGGGNGGGAKTSSQPAAVESASASVEATATAAAETTAAERAESASVKAAWSLHYTHENAYLNWVRNGLTSTAVGMGFVMFRVTRDDATFSLGGICLQLMGMLYVMLGSFQYLGSALALRRQLRVTPLGYAWYAFNAAWPPCLYLLGMRCVHDLHPDWLLEFVTANVDSLPLHLRERCFEIIAEAENRAFKQK